MYDGRTRLASQVADEVRNHFGGEVLRTSIPRSVRISEAPSYGQTVLTYDPGSSGALSYLEAAREMALRGVEIHYDAQHAHAGTQLDQQSTPEVFSERATEGLGRGLGALIPAAPHLRRRRRRVRQEEFRLLPPPCRC